MGEVLQVDFRNKRRLQSKPLGVTSSAEAVSNLVGSGVDNYKDLRNLIRSMNGVTDYMIRQERIKHGIDSMTLENVMGILGNPKNREHFGTHPKYLKGLLSRYDELIRHELDGLINAARTPTGNTENETN